MLRCYWWDILSFCRFSFCRLCKVARTLRDVPIVFPLPHVGSNFKLKMTVTVLILAMHTRILERQPPTTKSIFPYTSCMKRTFSDDDYWHATPHFLDSILVAEASVVQPQMRYMDRDRNHTDFCFPVTLFAYLRWASILWLVKKTYTALAKWLRPFGSSMVPGNEEFLLKSSIAII